MNGRVLVAGVGNIFKSDDGFATAVVTWLEANALESWPDWVVLRDYGIRGIHLAYDLLDDYDELVLVDAMHRDGAPGTVYVVAPDLVAPAPEDTLAVDPHDLSPQAVLALVPGLSGTLHRVTVVGCEPEAVDDGMGLSAVVARQVAVAGRAVCDLVAAADIRRAEAFSSAPSS